MSFLIKEAIEDDKVVVARFVMKLLNEINPNGCSHSLEVLQESSDYFISKKGSYTALAYDGAKVIGFVTLSESKAIYTLGCYGIINELYVEKDYRAQGLGKILINHSIEKAKKFKWSRLEVGAPLEEFSSVTKFYEGIGFKRNQVRLKYSLS